MSSYTVKMIMGNDTCTTVTTVDADSPADAAIAADLKWTGIKVRVVAVIDDLGICDPAHCMDDDHWCSTDDRHGHREDDGSCANCDYDI